MTVNTPVGILLVGYDIDSPSLTFAIETPPAHGALGAIGAPNCSPSGAGSICTATAIYTPNANYIGADSFTYSSYDGSLTSVPATVSLTVNPLSQTDLVMTNVTPNSSTVNQGGPLSVTDTVSNLGAASGGLRIAYHLSSDAVYGNGDDVAIPTVRVVISLAKGTSSTGTTALLVPSTTPPGSYYICAMADSLNQVAESNESNNTLCSSIQVTVPPPDLIISALSTTATTATKGHSFSISFTIKNQGGSKAGGFMTGFHLSTDADYGGGDDVPVNQTLSLPSLGVGANYSNGAFGLVVPSTTPSGTYYVCGMTDKNNAVAESDEGNNTNCTGTMITVP
jgi:subtilase family serine protease